MNTAEMKKDLSQVRLIFCAGGAISIGIVWLLIATLKYASSHGRQKNKGTTAVRST